MPRIDLQGRVVAITGGARGIGRATAEACARAGMKVAIGDLDPALAAATAGEIGSGVAGLGVDVRDRNAFDTFLREAEQRHGPLDALVNNAGVFFLGGFRDEDPAHTRQMVEVNLLGVMTGSQLALDRFVPRGAGHLVNIASSAGQIPVAGGATYAATKHAVVGLTRSLRGELAGTGVRTTVVMPGIVRTEMIGGFAPARGTRTVGPQAVGKAIVRALRSGRPEVFVPGELGAGARLVAGLPPRGSDALRRLARIDHVMTDADRGARAAYEARAEDR
jgi:NAD(P)-dependent dehydrogenase (short-subunit alcohol dehydrogenase family)